MRSIAAMTSGGMLRFSPPSFLVSRIWHTRSRKPGISACMLSRQFSAALRIWRTKAKAVPTVVKLGMRGLSSKTIGGAFISPGSSSGSG